MRISEKIEKAFTHFKRSYAFKMGGTQTVILPSGKSKFFDDREYYSGRGAKYNDSIKHDIIGDVRVSLKEYSAFLKELKEREQRQLNLQKEAEEKRARIKQAKEAGIYNFEPDSHYLELSEDEIVNNYFDAKRLAKTLGISIEDASLLSSEGKTYVFAKSADGKTYQLYHPDLSCNELSINVSIASPERIAKFKHEDWVKAPFAHLVGQSENKNHFVC